MARDAQEIDREDIYSTNDKNLVDMVIGIRKALKPTKDEKEKFSNIDKAAKCPAIATVLTADQVEKLGDIPKMIYKEVLVPYSHIAENSFIAFFHSYWRSDWSEWYDLREYYSKFIYALHLISKNSANLYKPENELLIKAIDDLLAQTLDSMTQKMESINKYLSVPLMRRKCQQESIFIDESQPGKIKLSSSSPKMLCEKIHQLEKKMRTIKR